MSELKQFKDKHLGDTVILMATGPTLNNFKDNLSENYYRCCVNGVIIHEELVKNLNYYIWSGDIDIPKHPQPGYHYIIKKIPNLGKKVTKFVNCWSDNSITGIMNIQTQIHPDKAKELGFIRYNQVYKNVHTTKNFHKDLSCLESGPSAYSVAFHAMQILLYMGFKRIILVGFDCGGSHSYKKFDECKNDICDWGSEINKDLVNYWKTFSHWMMKEYSDVVVEVIRPVGLKNIFKEYNN